MRQAANLWRLKARLWQHLVHQIPHDPTLAMLDSFPLPVCQCASAHRCRQFRGEADFGKDTLIRQTFSGWRVHVHLEWPGVIGRCGVAPANGHDLTVLPALAEQTAGMLIGDRTSWSRATALEWQSYGVDLLAPSRSAKRDPHLRWSARLSRVRYRIDTVFGQRASRCAIKRV